jgi:hypothetical protein
MLIGKLHGYEFHVPESGGKAGKGCNKTSSIQVRKGGVIEKNIRFTLADPASCTAAIEKAKRFAVASSMENANA